MVAWGVVFFSKFDIRQMRCKVSSFLQEKLVIKILEL
jgi:hypothetical protein